MYRFLVVPIQLDALHLAEPLDVVGALADFSRLPYFDGTCDVSADTAYISENLVASPFHDQKLTLRQGVHLHWALPDALTRSQAVDDVKSKIAFPAVPNLWLVTRHSAGVARHWIVESDYLYPEVVDGDRHYAAGGASGSICYPIHSGLREKGPPFRYMGRQLPLEDWLATEGQRAEDFATVARHPLTALGHGEPTFAAFYPNCHSVFGFYDSDPPESGAKYYVTGWYRGGEADFCQSAVFLKALAGKDGNGVGAAIQSAFNWNVSDDQGTSYQGPPPDRLLCYAGMILATGSGSAAEPVEASPLKIAVGNTATEALSAYLGHEFANEFFKGDTTHRRAMEDQLESLHLMADLEHRQLDIGPKFREARHTNGFRASSGGTVWTIRLPSAGTVAKDGSRPEELTLPDELAHALNQLNLAQQKYDAAHAQIISLRERLFADWYRYMLSAYPPDDQRDDYPDIDAVKFFIEEHDLKPLVDLEQSIGSDTLERTTVNVSLDSVSALTFGQQVNYWWNQVCDLLVDQHANFPALGSPDAVHKVAGSRFWQPNEPVVLLTGPAVEPTDRHKQTMALRCRVVELEDGQPADAAEADKRMEMIDHLFDKTVAHGLPWNPFMLEWEVRVEPMGGPTSNLHAAGRSYASEFISANYQLAENDVDLSSLTDPSPSADHAIYQGRSILTPHAKHALRRQIDAYFEKQILGAYYAAHAEAHRSPQFFRENRQAIIDWCRSASPDVVDDFMRFVLEIEQHVDADFHLLAQSLSGLNAAFLGQKQTMQLGIADPLGFADYQDFASLVRDAVGSHTRVAPQPMNDFNPIRSGRLTITRLRLIDTFGRHRDLTDEELQSVICADTLQNDRGATENAGIALAPRLMQPARLDLRWKSNGHGPGHEDHDDVEMNAHPATSPICGWLLPNNLDNSLMVFSPLGEALGSLDQNSHWQIAPGTPSGIQNSNEIDNPHLQRVVQWIQGKGSDFLRVFISTLDSAIENIDPENFAHHQELALLMGRPLAVARASLQLELKGLLAMNQSWDVFWQDLHNGRRGDADTDRVRDVDFPVRLGEHRQLNDGLGGYWVEAEHGALSADFFAPQSDIDDSSVTKREHLIHTYADGADETVRERTSKLQLLVKLNGPPVELTLLVDPRGKVHATSGILPVQSVEIPADQYAAALRALEVSFLSAPILCQRRQAGAAAQAPELPLPEEPGYQWRWVERDANFEWQAATTPTGQVSRQAHFAGPLEVREGWLLLSKAQDAAENQSNAPPL